MSTSFPSIYRLMMVLILSAMAACAGDTDDGEVGNGDDSDSGLTGDASSADATAENPSLMNAEVLQELYDLDFDEFFDKAVIKEEITEGNVTTFIYDSASGPICLYGTDFRAFIRDKGSNNMMMFLAGGGACWTGTMGCTPVAAEEMPVGMFDLLKEDNDESVVKDWNLVLVSYCDGSIFYGDNEFEEPDGTIRYHHGRQNLSAGIDLALEHFPNMEKILIYGSSAGGYGSYLAMGMMRMVYPQSELFVINDSGPGLQNLDAMDDIETRLEEWDMGKIVPSSCKACDAGRGHVTSLISWGLENDSGLTAAMASYDQDPIIGNYFLGLSGPDFRELLLRETDKVRAEFPDRFKRFVMAGASHVVQVTFNQAQIEDVKYSDWVRAMIEGDDTVWRDLIAEP